MGPLVGELSFADFDFGFSTFSLALLGLMGNLADLAEQLGKMMEYDGLKSTYTHYGL